MSLRELNGDDLLNRAAELAFKSTPLADPLAFVHLPQPLKNIYLISTFEFEYFNGGLSQFLTNSSGAFASETVTAFISVGALRTAELLSGVLDALGKAGLSLNELRWSQPKREEFDIVRMVDLFPAQFFEIVTPFHRQIREEDWDAEKLIAYLESNKHLLP